eukprot:1487444-Rhodomonas_salina.1
MLHAQGVVARWLTRGGNGSVWIDSGPTEPDGIQAYGTGLSVAQAGYAAMFGLRISDVFGNWASQRENVTVLSAFSCVFVMRCPH